MKKFVCCLIILLLVCNLVGCDGYYDSSILNKYITKIEIETVSFFENLSDRISQGVENIKIYFDDKQLFSEEEE